ncbi:hypothetical protein [Brachybacterium vulturis]|uniref:DoxX family protein n=1 Tax=Brachybacterium vulturis TaxID=2017484 RepID=UPI003734DF97
MTERSPDHRARLLGPAAPTSLPRTLARIALGGMLTFAGISHLTVAREEFGAQVPNFVPFSEETTVVASGIAEITLGSALALLARRRIPLGWAAALFFVAIFPGNIAQWVHARDGFGLDTDTKRFLRLWFQPGLVGLALWSTGAWRDRSPRRRDRG